jgi:hypothetical protein
MEVIMFTKMKCVVLFLMVLSVKASAVDTIINITTSTTQTTTIVLGNLVPENQMFLAEEIISLSSQHLSPVEISSLRKHLEELICKAGLQTQAGLQTLNNIHQQLKRNVYLFAARAMAFAAIGRKVAPTAPKTDPTKQSLANSIAHVLRTINPDQLAQLAQNHGALIKEHADSLGGIISETLATQLPTDCIQALIGMLTTLSQLEHPEQFQAALADFITKYKEQLPTL